MIVVATPVEVELVEKVLGERAYEYYPIVVAGVGGANMYESLRNIPRDTHILNIGYAGSVNSKIGTLGIVTDCKVYHPNVTYHEPIYNLGMLPVGDKEYEIVTCLTSNDFVLEADKNLEHCVFDMELAYICAMGFKSVSSIKVISDNLSLHQYDKTTGDNNVKDSKI